MSKPKQITEGQFWTFVHPDGKRVRYRVDQAEVNDAPSAIVKIVNCETGGIGWVTKHWMRRSDNFPGGHFEFDGESMAALAA